MHYLSLPEDSKYFHATVHHGGVHVHGGKRGRKSNLSGTKTATDPSLTGKDITGSLPRQEVPDAAAAHNASSPGTKVLLSLPSPSQLAPAAVVTVENEISKIGVARPEHQLTNEAVCNAEPLLDKVQASGSVSSGALFHNLRLFFDQTHLVWALQCWGNVWCITMYICI